VKSGVKNDWIAYHLAEGFFLNVVSEVCLFDVYLFNPGAGHRHRHQSCLFILRRRPLWL
jgi:hypothetical protein